MPRNITRFVLAALGIGGCLSLTMCGGGGETGNTTGTQCPNGICGPGSGGGTSSSTSSSGTGGTMGSSSSGTGGMMSSSSGMASSSGMSSSSGMASSSGMMSSSSSTSSSTSSGSTCTSAWLCTPWDTGNPTPGATDTATRTCTDKNNCPTPTNPPATSVTLPHLDVHYFECNVEPILDKKCSQLGCHGTETGRSLRVYSKARLREATAQLSSSACTNQGTKTGLQCSGANSCPCTAPHTQKEWQRNFDAARGFALYDDGTAIPMSKLSSDSQLINEPVVGGASHAGIHLFKNGDADYTTILNWLGGATAPANCSIGIN